MFRNYIRKLVKWALESDVPQPAEVTSYHGNAIKSKNPSSISDGNNGMNFTVYNAIGGKVIQFTTYDPIRDRGFSNLYIVTDKEDLGEELGQIITKESLAR